VLAGWCCCERCSEAEMADIASRSSNPSQRWADADLARANPDRGEPADVVRIAESYALDGVERIFQSCSSTCRSPAILIVSPRELLLPDLWKNKTEVHGFRALNFIQEYSGPASASIAAWMKAKFALTKTATVPIRACSRAQGHLSPQWR